MPNEAKQPTPPSARVFLGAARAVGKAADRTLRFIGTDETPDRYNTIFKRDGWDFSEFRKNPVFLFHHNHDAATPTLPVGRVVNIEKSDASGRAGWAFDVQFASRDLYPFADLVYNMYREGFLNAVSVGFVVKQRTAVTDEAEQKRLGLEPGFAEVYERTELTELSAVPVPGNQNALIQRMRAFVPEALQDAIKLEDGAELDERWLADRLNLVREALKAEADAADLTAALRADAPPAPAPAPTPAEVVAALAPAPAEPDPLMRVINELHTELKSLRADVSALRDEVRKAPPTPSVSAPPVPRKEDPTAAPITRDAVEVLLSENLDALRRAHAACR